MNEPATIRFAIFAAALMTMLLWEWLHPFRRSQERKSNRLARHLGLMMVNFIVLRVLSGAGAYGVALLATERGWGALPTLALPEWSTAIVSLLLLDFAIYAQHVVFHKVPFLWRLHKVHHSDTDFDTTTAIRFHPLELVLSMFFKMALVAGLGIAPTVVLAFETLLNACAQFNHGNIRLGPRQEHLCRLLLITPDLHRIHHSSDPRETDSNFGFSVPWWDHVCGTYLARPARGQEGLHIGLGETPRDTPLRLPDLLKLPFQTRRSAAN